MKSKLYADLNKVMLDWVEKNYDDISTDLHGFESPLEDVATAMTKVSWAMLEAVTEEASHL